MDGSEVTEIKEYSEIAYDNYVLLPSLKAIHNEIMVGHFSKRVWNMVIDLYFRLPETVSKNVDFSVLKNAESSKDMILMIFVQMRHYLETQGFLRERKVMEGGSL